MEKKGYIYIFTNSKDNVLYTGVTSNLMERIYEHKEKLVDGFSKKYNLCKLVYYEVFDRVDDAITREKQIKGGSRDKKIKLIQGMNPDFKDLYDEL